MKWRWKKKRKKEEEEEELEEGKEEELIKASRSWLYQDHLPTIKKISKLVSSFSLLQDDTLTVG